MTNFLNIFNRITWFKRKKVKYTKIVENKEKKKNSYYFALQSSIYSLMIIIYSLIGAVLLFYTFNAGVIMRFVLTIIAILFFICSLIYIILALVLLRYQFLINKRWWTTLSLVIFVSTFFLSILQINIILN